MLPEYGENSDDAAPDEDDREQQQETAAGGDGAMDGTAAGDLTRERSATESEPDDQPHTPGQSSIGTGAADRSLCTSSASIPTRFYLFGDAPYQCGEKVSFQIIRKTGQ